MYPSINIGSIALPTAEVLYLFGAYICLSLIEKTAVRVKHNPEAIYTLGTLAVVAGVVGARLVFVIEHWSAYKTNLLGIIWPLNVGYTGWAGLLIGVAAAFFFARAKQMPPQKTLDALIPGIIFGFIIISLKDFLAGPGLGAISTLPWAIPNFGVNRHPVQLYEIVAGGLALLVWWRTTGSPTARPGFAFLTTTAVFAAGRLYLDAFRDNAWLTPNGLHIWQLISLAVLIIAFLLLKPHLLPQQHPTTPS